MNLAGWDSETHLIKAGMMAPRLVCVSYDDGKQPLLVDRPRGLTLMRHALRQPDLHLVAHNLPYDLGVLAAEEASLLPLIFDAFRDGRLHCTIVRQMLLDVALGMRKFRRVNGVVSKATYGLDDLVRLYFGEHLEKADTWRLRYALLDGVDTAEYPPEARDYAIRDAVKARQLFETQTKEIRELFDLDDLPSARERQFGAWALHLMSMWGLRTEQSAVDRFITHCEEKIEEMHQTIGDFEAEEGIAPGKGVFKKNGSRTMAEISRRVVESLTKLDIEIPMTEPSPKFPKGQVRTNRDTLLLTDDPVLHVLAESMSFQTHLKQWGPVVRAGVHRNVCARYNPLVETGRVSCSGSEGQEGTNFLNPPRAGDVRPCFVPRAGWLYCSTDADTIELRAHAQNCLDLIGWSKMAEYLQKQHTEGGPDLHVVLAAGIMGIEPEEAHARMKAGDKEVEDARQFAKIPNFGFPGGLGAPTFVAYAAGQMKKEDFKRWLGSRSNATDKAKQLRETWFRTFPENREYFRVVGDMIDRDRKTGTIRQLMSGRIRGETRFTAAANGFFQGRVADAMLEAVCRISEECYTGRMTGPGNVLVPGRSPLFGSRPVLFLYDEPICEHPEDGTEHLRAERQRQIVVSSLQRWLPDIPCTSTPVLMRRWYKGAKPVKVDGKLVATKPLYRVNGVVVPFLPSKLGKQDKVKVEWVHDTGEQLAEAA